MLGNPCPNTISNYLSLRQKIANEDVYDHRASVVAKVMMKAQITETQ